jgi:hypothetical protein
MTEVAHASWKHDSFSVYQAVQKYTPKQPKKRIRIRLPTGAPASQEEVLTMTKDYITEIWQPANEIVLKPCSAPGVPFPRQNLPKNF